MVNHWLGKGGQKRAEAREYQTWQEAQVAAFVAVYGLIELAGECIEEFLVFVGSHRQLKRYLGRFRPKLLGK